MTDRDRDDLTDEIAEEADSLARDNRLLAHGAELMARQLISEGRREPFKHSVGKHTFRCVHGSNVGVAQPMVMAIDRGLVVPEGTKVKRRWHVATIPERRALKDAFAVLRLRVNHKTAGTDALEMQRDVEEVAEALGVPVADIEATHQAEVLKASRATDLATAIWQMKRIEADCKIRDMLPGRWAFISDHVTYIDGSDIVIAGYQSADADGSGHYNCRLYRAQSPDGGPLWLLEMPIGVYPQSERARFANTSDRLIATTTFRREGKRGDVIIVDLIAEREKAVREARRSAPVLHVD